MKDAILSLVDKWSTPSAGEEYREIYQKIYHLSENLYYDYEPTSGPNLSFLNRLENWLANCSKESDKKRLFKLIPQFFYIGKEEFNSLYRVAYNTSVAKWLVDEIKLDLETTNAEEKLSNAVKETWFCPISDSMRINQFYHVNLIPGVYDFRPDWRSLAQFGSKQKIKSYIKTNKIKRLVLLEDFVGSGSQMMKSIIFASGILKSLNILVVPLVICPVGEETARLLETKFSNVKIRPIIKTPETSFVTPLKTKGEMNLFSQIRELANRVYLQTTNGRAPSDDKPYGPFGFNDTGGLIIMHTNTPDNTLPLIHWESETWNPLFKRHSRV